MSTAFATTIRSLAEDQAVDYAPWPGSETVHGPGFDIWFAPPDDLDGTIVRRIRLSPDGVEEGVTAARRLMVARGHSTATWSVGGSATPTDLVEHLGSLGMQPDDDPIRTAVVLQREPIAGRHDVEVRSVSSAADHLRTYLASVEDVTVATIRATFTDIGVVLHGDASPDHPRGTDACEALVRACWDDAVSRGTPLLTTLARPASHPTLLRLGFTDACDVQILLDRFELVS